MITCNVATYIYFLKVHKHIRTGGAVMAAQATAGGIIPPVKSFNQPSIKSFFDYLLFQSKNDKYLSHSTFSLSCIEREINCESYLFNVEQKPNQPVSFNFPKQCLV